MSTKSALKATTAAPRRVIVSASNKGGVGKTVLTKSVALYLREAGKEVAVYDCDGLVGGLLPAIGSRNDKGALVRNQDPRVGCGYYDFRSDRDQATFLDSVADLPETNIFLHDLPGGSIREFPRIADRGEEGEVSAMLDAFEKAGCRLTFLMTLSPLLPATESVGVFLNLFGDRVDYAVAINRVWGSASDYVFWLDPKRAERAKFLEMGGIEFELPAIPAASYALTEAYHIPFSGNVESPFLKLSQRSQVEGYWKRFREEVSKVDHLIGK